MNRFVNRRSDDGGKQWVSWTPLFKPGFTSSEDRTIHGLVTGMEVDIDDDSWTGIWL